MIYDKKVSAIILAAGTSTRFGGEANKVFADLKGNPVLYYSLKAFAENPLIDEIILVINPLGKAQISEITSKFKKPIKIINGGSTRKQSVHNALKIASGDIVIIHDGARPMLAQEHINNCLEAMQNFKGISIAVKSKDTIKITNDNNIVETTTPRKNTWLIQTPQCFDKNTLLNAHEKHAGDETITDDCMLLELEGINVKLIEGNYNNLKVTTKEDINILETF